MMMVSPTFLESCDAQNRTKVMSKRILTPPLINTNDNAWNDGGFGDKVEESLERVSQTLKRI